MSGYPEYLVIKRQRCGVCEGIGYVIHPLWRIWRQFSEKIGLSTDEKARQWFKVECEVCNGRGYIESKVPLTEALRELGVWNES